MLKSKHHLSESVISDVMRIISHSPEVHSGLRANALVPFRQMLSFLEGKGLYDAKSLVRYEACRFCYFLYRGDHSKAEACPNAACPGCVKDADGKDAPVAREGNTVDFLYRWVGRGQGTGRFAQGACLAGLSNRVLVHIQVYTCQR